MTVTVITEGATPSVEHVGYDQVPVRVVKQWAADGDKDAAAWLADQGLTAAGEFDPEKHPRDERGRWTDTPGGGEKADPTRHGSKQHRARQKRRDWGTEIGFNPGPGEGYLDPEETRREAERAAKRAAERALREHGHGLAASAMAVVFTWNEDDHPRDSRGRFGPKEAGIDSVERYGSFFDVKPAPGFDRRLGNCYENAARYVLDHDGATLVHGSFKSREAPMNRERPINHAWVENADGTVHDAVLGVTFHPDDWARLFETVPFARYDKTQMSVKLLQTEHWGPWEEESHAVAEAHAA